MNEVRIFLLISAAVLLIICIIPLSLLIHWRRAFFPGKTTTPERLKIFSRLEFPISSAVTLYWNKLQIPYIKATTDRDTFFSLGLVHMHLRGAQLEVLRMVASGRLSEIAGPVANDLDTTIRVLNLGRAVPEIEKNLPAETRELLTAFVQGLNFYKGRGPTPPELPLLGLSDKDWADKNWSVHDVLLLSRLAGADVNWFLYFNLLKTLGTEEHLKTWQRILDIGGDELVASHTPNISSLQSLLISNSRSGSNSVVIGSQKSQTGKPLIANDPHLGLGLPNFWLIVGIESPSFHCVGLMPAGVPIFGLGRNPEVAWGGTNARAASSDLFDVSHLAASEFSERIEIIRTRFWRDKEIKIRETRFGPVISDAPLLKNNADRAVALKWVGHNPSDEITAFFNAARAKTALEFGKAFEPYAVSGQNMLAADAAGNIIRVLAAALPTRKSFPSPEVVLPANEESLESWNRIIGTAELPATLNPVQNFIVSANDRPPPAVIPIGFLFSDGERVERLAGFIAEREIISPQDLKLLQADTLSAKSQKLAQQLADEISALGDGDSASEEVETLLRSWNGNYGKDSRGSLAFELFLGAVCPRVYSAANAQSLSRGYTQWNFLSRYILQDLSGHQDKERIMRESVAQTWRGLKKWHLWGDVHRLTLAHFLSNIPLLGRFFVLEDLPASGSRETPMKTSHELVTDVHKVSYGSQSRHISDLSSPDENYFLLLGGEDGFLGSDNFGDQIRLWEEGKYIRMPLSKEGVEREFEYAIRLKATVKAKILKTKTASRAKRK